MLLVRGMRFVGMLCSRMGLGVIVNEVIESGCGLQLLKEFIDDRRQRVPGGYGRPFWAILRRSGIICVN